MKLARVNLRHVIPGGVFATACLTADKGHELSFEGGVVTARHGDKVLLVPLSNVLGMEPLEPPKKK